MTRKPAPGWHHLAAWLLAACALLPALPAAAQAQRFSFGVLAPLHGADPDGVRLRAALEAMDEDRLAFVLANGIKAAGEPCSDQLYLARRALLDQAQNGIIVSATGSDWAECRNTHGRPAAAERLGRLRELFFSDEFSLGGTRLPLHRQSTTPKFSNFGENMRWEAGEVMFGTLNLPANNNHYLPDAGRNSEFEDRLIANKDWLKRLFVQATLRKMDAVVLFTDGNPDLFGERRPRNARRDGFLEIRREILRRAAGFPGRVLLIHAEAAPPTREGKIRWHGNLGALGAGGDWLRVSVDPAAPAMFSASAQRR